MKTTLAAASVLAVAIAFAQDPGTELPVRRIPGLGESAELYFSPDGKSLVGTVKAVASSRDARPGERKLYTYTMDVSSLGLGGKR